MDATHCQGLAFINNFMANYRKKPVVIEAWEAKEISFNAGNNWRELPSCIQESYEKGGWVFLTNGEIHIPTLEGTMNASPNDFIIKGVNGEFYPCKPDIFEKTYEKVDQLSTGQAVLMLAPNGTQV